MSQVQLLRIVVASPSDTQAERDLVSVIANELNSTIARTYHLRLEVIRWEADGSPGFHPQGPQGRIDAILRIENCDLLIGIFWKRFGTPVYDANSGTVHEFQRAYNAWQQQGHPQIMMYFNRKASTPKTEEDIEQWGQVLKFQRAFPQEGLAWSYSGKAQFERLLRQHLTQWLLGQRGQVAPAPMPTQMLDTKTARRHSTRPEAASAIGRREAYRNAGESNMVETQIDARGRGRGYVVFCRLCDLTNMAADRLAQTVTDFDRALTAALDSAEEAQRFSSPYGGGVVVWERVRGALDVTRRLIQETTDAGVRIAVGLNTGPVARASDVIGHTPIGSAINVAARLAAVPEVEGHTAACTAFVDAANQGLDYVRRQRFFDAPIVTQVKRTQFAYSLIIAEGFAQPLELAVPSVTAAHEPQDMYVLVYDLARFSELPDEEQRQVVERLAVAVQETEVSVGRNLHRETDIWYAPAGDGGALIFRAHLGAVAWTLATTLQRQATRGGLDLRTGLHLGQMVARTDGIPIGPAVLTADRASAQAPTGGLCVTRIFWEALRTQDREEWQVQPVADLPDFLLVTPRITSDVFPTTRSPHAESVSSTTASMDAAWKARMVDALLACSAMQNRHTREAIVGELPEVIKHTILRSPSDRVDVINIVNRCLVYPEGLAKLVESLRLYEGDSPHLQSVEACLQ